MKLKMAEKVTSKFVLKRDDNQNLQVTTIQELVLHNLLSIDQMNTLGAEFFSL